MPMSQSYFMSDYIGRPYVCLHRDVPTQLYNNSNNNNNCSKRSFLRVLHLGLIYWINLINYQADISSVLKLHAYIKT